MAFQTFNGVYGPITPQFISPASGSLTGFDPMSVYATAGLPPMPGTPAADELRTAGKKHSHKGLWGTLVALGVLAAMGVAACRMGAATLVSGLFSVIKNQGFKAAKDAGEFGKLWGEFTKTFKEQGGKGIDWVKGLFTRAPRATASDAGSGN